MKTTYDLSALDWELSGWAPNLWAYSNAINQPGKPDAQVVVRALVPGSVQKALLDGGHLPDWNQGLNAQACEWVENRHWIYEAALPDEWFDQGKSYRLRCLGLDYAGHVYLNGREAGQFCGTHVPHVFDLTRHLTEKGNVLRIQFDIAPRWLGQFGRTSQMTEWKTRFNYTWDWQPRLVQIGIWDAISIEEITGGIEIASLNVTTDADVGSATGIVRVRGMAAGTAGKTIHCKLRGDGQTVLDAHVSVGADGAFELDHAGLPVRLWWPNGEGGQPLYDLDVTLLSAGGNRLDSQTRRIGFRHIEWEQCEDSPAGADPWLCVVNGRRVFLQGVNFPPMLPNYADTTDDEYRRRLTLYREIGVNTFRINACQYLEKEIFYSICDELGLMVWQEFPITSSGIENLPPTDPVAIEEAAKIASSFIERRRHHAGLLLWSGSNEQCDENMRPVGLEQPMLARLGEVVAAEDPGTRYIPTSPSGPRFSSELDDLGKGLSWDVHGPWKMGDDSEIAAYFAADDALFRSELGAPGASPADLIRRYSSPLDPLPVDGANPLWRNPVTWWLETDRFKAERGAGEISLDMFADWSRTRQATALSIAMKACKDRFPRCGGVLLWCGHDCFPCPTNTSIIDFEGNPKPAALALAEIWKARPKSER